MRRRRCNFSHLHQSRFSFFSLSCSFNRPMPISIDETSPLLRPSGHWLYFHYFSLLSPGQCDSCLHHALDWLLSLSFSLMKSLQMHMKMLSEWSVFLLLGEMKRKPILVKNSEKVSLFFSLSLPSLSWCGAWSVSSFTLPHWLSLSLSLSRQFTLLMRCVFSCRLTHSFLFLLWFLWWSTLFVSKCEHSLNSVNRIEGETIFHSLKASHFPPTIYVHPANEEWQMEGGDGKRQQNCLPHNFAVINHAYARLASIEATPTNENKRQYSPAASYLIFCGQYFMLIYVRSNMRHLADIACHHCPSSTWEYQLCTSTGYPLGELFMNPP